MTIEHYISSMNQRYKLGNSTEYTFRGDLMCLIVCTVYVSKTKEAMKQANVEKEIVKLSENNSAYL